MKLVLAGIYHSLGSWRLRFCEDLESANPVKADFEITVNKGGMLPEAQAFYGSLKPGEFFELLRVSK